MTKIKRYQFIFLMSLFSYVVTSYLLLFRDAFILERIALALGNPAIETVGLQLASLLKVNYSATAMIILSFSGLFWSFWRILLIERDIPPTSPKLRGTSLLVGKSLMFWIAVIVLVFVSFPALSTDVFDYNNTNRVAFIHGADPWIYPAETFPEDDLIYFGSWTHRASVYPPVTFIVSSILYLVFGGGFLGSLIGFKVVNLLWLLLIHLIFIRVLPKKDQWKALLVTLNPLVLIEFIGNAHNDLLLGLFVLLTFLAIKQKKYLQSALMCALGFLAKFSLVLYVPFILWRWLEQRELKRIVNWLVVFVTVITIGLVPFYKAFPYLMANLGEQFSIYQKSLPTVVRYLLIPVFGDGQANDIQKLITTPTYGLIMAYYVFRKKLSLIDLSVIALSVYVFVQAPMLQPWYLIWFLPLIPFVKEKRLLLMGFVFCFSAMMTYPAYYLSLSFKPLAIWWQLVLALVMIVPPAIVLWIPSRWYKEIETRFTIQDL